MKCEKCGAEIHNLLVDHFNYDGSDSPTLVPIEEEDSVEAVWVDVDPNWTGDGLSEEEQAQTIECPKCRKFPFKSREIQTYQFIRVVCFRDKGETMKGETNE